MKKDLPYLNKERLNIIFDHVYDIVDINDSKKNFNEEKLSEFLEMLKSMQLFNYHHRCNDTRNLFFILHPKVFNFEINSGATTVWLSLILAIKDLYGFSNEKLISTMKNVSIIK